MNRREALHSFVLFPFVKFLPGKKVWNWNEVHLPIDCDLSFTSLQWAINQAKEKELGMPKELVCDLSLWDTVHRMMLAPDICKEFLKVEELKVTVSDQLQNGEWILRCEYGQVRSLGPS